jgi:hypothetical protein
LFLSLHTVISHYGHDTDVTVTVAVTAIITVADGQSLITIK